MSTPIQILLKLYFSHLAFFPLPMYTKVSIKIGRETHPMKYLLGMDGGGTATKISAADRDGHVIARHTAGPLNVNGQSP